MTASEDIMLMGKSPNFLGSWDLYDAPGQRITVTIDTFTSEKVPNGKGGNELVTVLHFKESIKPLICNLTNRKTLCRLYKTKSVQELKGKQIIIGIEKVHAFGKIHDALRIVPEIPSAKRFYCEVCSNEILAQYGKNAEQLAAYTKGKFGKSLCSKCATTLKEAETATESVPLGTIDTKNK